MTDASSLPIVFAGIPAKNLALYHRVRFAVGDPAALLEMPGTPPRRTFLVRDIELERARRDARADEAFCPRDFEPEGGLSGDRETATAQAFAEMLRRRGIAAVRGDRTLPLVFAEHLRQAGIAIEYDPAAGVAERRRKDAAEIEALRDAQRATERAMERACRTVARGSAASDGTLRHEGEPLTSEGLRQIIDLTLLELGFDNPTSIVAGGVQGGDCHDHGHGPLRTSEPVIVDIFPRSKSSLYNGDCTRTVVHGAVPETIARMHAAVIDAKRAGIAATRAGATGEDVHRATLAEIHRHGFESGAMPAAEDPRSPEWIGMVHGTGHGIGLEVHEPPLLDFKGPELVAGDALTIEPGLYGRGVGGVRVEDLVIVTERGCENLNTLPEGLDWR
ncbi:MAG: M24 family metallopeptidase [Phycisphaerales bacterium]